MRSVPPLRHRVDGVQDEVGEDLVELRRPAHHHRHRRRARARAASGRPALDLLLLPARAGDGERVADDLVEVESRRRASSGRSRANFWMRRTVSAPPVAAFSMTSRPRRTTSTLPGVLAHELGVAEDGLEQVVEVVRDAARHLSERGELLGLVHLRLELALRGRVAHDREHALEARRRAPCSDESVTARFSGRSVVPLARHVEGAARDARARERARAARYGSSGRRSASGPADGVLGASSRRCARRRGSSPGSRPSGVDGDDRVARGADQLLEGLLGLGHLAVEARVADGHGEVLGQHLEQLALARVDGARARAVGRHEVAQRRRVVADRADDRRAGRRRPRAAPRPGAPSTSS